MPSSLQIAHAEIRVIECKYDKLKQACILQLQSKEEECERVRQELQAYIAVQVSSIVMYMCI